MNLSKSISISGVQRFGFLVLQQAVNRGLTVDVEDVSEDVPRWCCSPGRNTKLCWQWWQLISFVLWTHSKRLNNASFLFWTISIKQEKCCFLFFNVSSCTSNCVFLCDAGLNIKLYRTASLMVPRVTLKLRRRPLRAISQAKQIHIAALQINKISWRKFKTHWLPLRDYHIISRLHHR